MSDHTALFFIHFEYVNSQNHEKFYSNIISHDLTKEGDVNEIARNIIRDNDLDVDPYSLNIKVVSFNTLTIF